MDGNTPNGPEGNVATPDPTPTPTPTPTPGDGDVKMVPESQLLALKAKHKKALDDMKQAHDGVYQQNLQLVSDKESLEEKANRLPGLETELAEHKTRLDLSEAARAYSDAASVEQRRSQISTTYKVDPELLKDKDPAALDAIEEALKIVSKPSDARLAIAAGGGGTGEPTKIERAARIIAEAEAHQGVGSGSFNKPPE